MKVPVASGRVGCHARVVMRQALYLAGRIGSTGWVRSKA